jgi:hypothetical protein
MCKPRVLSVIELLNFRVRYEHVIGRKVFAVDLNYREVEEEVAAIV